MATDLAINASLTEMKEALVQDELMVKNMRKMLLKTQRFEMAAALKSIEENIGSLMQAIDAALPPGPR